MSQKLENLKPLPKTILPKLGTPSNIRQNSNISQNPEIRDNFLAPIQICPPAPDLNKISLKSKDNLKRLTEHKFAKSYNSLINSLEPKESESNYEPEIQEETINPLIAKALEEEGETQDSFRNLESLETVYNPKDSKDSKDSKFLKESEDPSNPKDIKQISKDPLKSLDLVIFKPEETEQLLFLQAKTEDLDEDVIETVKISRKECRVVDFKNKRICKYSEARDNTDNLILKYGDYFYSYSKQGIYDQYEKCHQQLYFHFKLHLIQDTKLPLEFDTENFCIPMIQIVRVLEYSHPVYEIEKTKFTMNLFNLKPIKLFK